VHVLKATFDEAEGTGGKAEKLLIIFAHEAADCAVLPQFLTSSRRQRIAVCAVYIIVKP
jgi:hypothetical protein